MSELLLYLKRASGGWRVRSTLQILPLPLRGMGWGEGQLRNSLPKNSIFRRTIFAAKKDFSSPYTPDIQLCIQPQGANFIKSGQIIVKNHQKQGGVFDLCVQISDKFHKLSLQIKTGVL